jgi:hypothetical protein
MRRHDNRARHIEFTAASKSNNNAMVIAPNLHSMQSVCSLDAREKSECF